MPRTRKTTKEELEELRRKKKELEAQEQALVARQKTEDRAVDTRRKIVVGSLAIKNCEFDAKWAEYLASVCDKAVADKDRELIADIIARKGGSEGVTPPARPSPGRAERPPEPRS